MIYAGESFVTGICQTIYASENFVTVVCNFLATVADFFLAIFPAAITAISMIDITRFFENHLANREISAEELRQQQGI